MYPAGYRTPFAVESPFCNTVSAGGGDPKHFPASIINFESFPNNCCASRDCRLTGYFIINMWKCCLLFELLCIWAVLYVPEQSITTRKVVQITALAALTHTSLKSLFSWHQPYLKVRISKTCFLRNRKEPERFSVSVWFVFNTGIYL
jgi:hypothetical protein